MPNVLQFPKPQKNSRIKLIEQLETLLAQAISGDICSLAYLVERPDHTHRYGLEGEYLEHPEDVFIPVTKGIYGLCTHIHDSGLTI